MSKTFSGTVISLKMQNTAVVSISRIVSHPLYLKRMKKDKKIKADTAGMSLAVGDPVKIVETKPISKDKHFKVMEVLKK